MELKKYQTPLSVRERIAFRLVMFLLKLIGAYEYEHQFNEWYTEMKQAIIEKA